MFASAVQCYVVDCITQDDLVVLLIKSKDIGKIVGYRGCIVKVFERLWQRKVKIVQYADELSEIIKNYFRTNCKIEKNADYVKIFLPACEFGKCIAKNGVKAEALRKILKRHFKIEKVKFLPTDL